MYIRKLNLKNVKLFRDVTLDFTRGASPRMWTVILGENGTCKTTALQAIAMAASGPSIGARLATSGRVDVLRALRNRSRPGEARINAWFGFPQGGHEGFEDPGGKRNPRVYPRWPAKTPRPEEPTPRPEEPPVLASQLYQMGGTIGLSGVSWYVGHEPSPADEGPLEELRTREPLEPHWFVAGYGVDRNLPHPESTIDRNGVQERLQSLFGGYNISATRWANTFTLAQNTLAVAFQDTLRQLIRRSATLLPDLEDLQFSQGEGASKRTAIERQTVRERVGGSTLDLPMAWLSQGYQSSLAWISDLVGQILFEAQVAVPPDEMEGLVLIDELDLHLHPVWQVNIVQALKDVFPRLQFVVTTHSPLVITSCEADEIVRLERRDGEVVVDDQPAPSPRTLSGTELYWNYFDLRHLIPNPQGRALYDYRELARNGARTPAEEERMRALLGELKRAGLDPGQAPFPVKAQA